MWEFYAPLMSGARLVMARPEGHRDPGYLVGMLADERITVLQVVPSLLDLLLAEPGLERAAWLARLYCGGEALHRAQVERLWSRLPGPQVINLYGPTECSIDATYGVSERAPTGRALEPIGWPIANMRAHVLDPSMEPVPAGVPGELYLGGAGVGLGYLNRPDLTRERFIPDPFGEGLLYRTGDLVRRLSSGALDYLGRVDQQVKLRGYRIELGEIEAVIAQHPAVGDAVALVREDTPGDRRLTVYIVPRAEPPSPADLRAFAAAKLPEHMVPSAYVTLAAWPRLGSGKIDRRALPAPEASAFAGRLYTPPRGPVEEAIAAIFAEVLGVSPVGAHDSFFELGGHSLLATQAGARLRGAFDIDLPLRALFEAPSPALLAPRISAALRAGRGGAVPPLLRAERGTETPLSFAQERLWFLDQLEPGDPAYIVSTALRLDGALDRAALERALQTIVARHEVLRTTFRSDDGKAVQVIHPEMTLSLAHTDLASIDASSQEERLKAEVSAEQARSFDLAEGPLFRARLFSLGPQSHVLVLSIHHIISDAWSAGVVSRELALLYEAFTAGRPSPLPDLPLQYADVALWQRRWLDGDTLGRELSYWRDALGGAPQTLDFPTDRPRPPARVGRGARAPIFIPASTIKGLEDLARREGATLYMTLLAAISLLLYRYSGQPDILIGSPIAGRGQPETEQLIGFFINTLVLRARLADDLSFRDLLGQVKDTCLGAYAHQDMPFERLVQELAPERDPGRSPLFQVYFNLQNNPREPISLSGLTLLPLPNETTTSKFDLTFITAPAADGLRGTLTYNNDIFDPSTIERLLGHLGTLCAEIVKGPTKRMDELSLLGEEEQERLLVAWNQTDLERPADELIHDLFESTVDRIPGAPALVAGPISLSYIELDQRANRLAHHLRDLGVGPDVIVGLCLDRSASLIVALLAVLKAGGAYLPLDASYPEARASRRSSTRPSAVSSSRSARSAPRSPGPPRPARRRHRLDRGAPRLPPTAGNLGPEPLLRALHLGLHRQAQGRLHRAPPARQLRARRLRAHESARRCSLSARLHLLGRSRQHGCSFPALHRRLPPCLARRAHDRSRGFATYVDAHAIDCPKIVPRTSARLGAPTERCLPKKLLVLGGEASSWELRERLHALSPELRIMNHYGPTETTVGVLTFLWSAAFARRARPLSPVSDARPLPVCASTSSTPPGTPPPSAFPARSISVDPAWRVHQSPRVTDERFIPDPFRDDWGARLYRTGDRAPLPARRQFLDLPRSRRSSGEDPRLSRRARRDRVRADLPPWNQGRGGARRPGSGPRRQAPRGLCGAQGGAGAADLTRFLADRLPAWSRRRCSPSKRSLCPPTARSIAARSSPWARPRKETASPRLAPRSKRCSPTSGPMSSARSESVSTRASPSSAATRSSPSRSSPGPATPSRPRCLCGPCSRRPPSRPSPRASRPRSARARACSLPIVAVLRPADLPLSAQERLWFLDQLGAGQRLLQRACPPPERAARPRLPRPRPRRGGAPPRGAPHLLPGRRWSSIVVHRPRCTPLAACHRSEHLARGRAGERRPPGGGDRGQEALRSRARPASVRARVLRLGDTEHALLLTLHHIVSDAWTRGILGREVAALHRLPPRQASPLAPLPIQYADYAACAHGSTARPSTGTSPTGRASSTASAPPWSCRPIAPAPR
ncbi:MAG: condensation domain-containing protein [Byssovorax sp.]